MRRLDDDFISGAMAFGEGLQSLEDRLRKRHEDKLKLLVEQQGGDWRRAAEVAQKDPKLSKSWRYIFGSEPNPESIPSTYQLTDEEKAEAARIKAGLEPTRSQRLESIHRAEQMTGRVMPHEMYTEWANMPDPYENVKESLYRETQPYWGITEQPMPFVPREYESQYPGVGYQMNEMLPGSRAARQTAYTANAISQREARKARIRQGDEKLAFQKQKEETDVEQWKTVWGVKKENIQAATQEIYNSMEMKRKEYELKLQKVETSAAPAAKGMNAAQIKVALAGQISRMKAAEDKLKSAQKKNIPDPNEVAAAAAEHDAAIRDYDIAYKNIVGDVAQPSTGTQQRQPASARGGTNQPSRTGGGFLPDSAINKKVR